jgi:two-component system, cell cycle sensor histidine kinase and response regulator CckA
MTTPLRCLLVEDSEDDAVLVLRQLREGGFDVTSERVDTPEAMRAALGRQSWDLVIADYQMPRFSGVAALQLLQASGLDLPFIIVSGIIGEDTAVAAIKMGAADYLIKDRLARLGSAVTHAMADSRSRRDRRQMDETLRIANAQVGQLLEHSPAVLYVLKVDGDTVVPQFVTENIKSLLGFAAAETSGVEWWLGQLHPDDRERAVNSRTDTFKAGASRVEYRLRHKDGHYCWVDDSRRLIRDAAGAPVELSGVWTDITERKRAEEIVRQASRRVVRNRRAQAGIDLAILVMATALIYVFAARFRWLEGITRWILANELRQLPEIILSTVFLMVGLLAFGLRRWREAESELTSRQHAQAALSLLHDELDRRVKQRTDELSHANQALHAEIAERRRTGEALRTAEERMRFALEAAHVGIWDMDYTTGVTRWSEILESQYGLQPGTFGGTLAAFVERVHPDDRRAIIETIAKAMKSGADFSTLNRSLSPDGTARWLAGAGRIILGAHGEPVRGVGISQDVTERRTLEAQFQQAQKMEAVGRLAGGVAHDFNNLLTVILGFCELLLAGQDPDAARQADIAEIQKAGERAAGLTRQLLAFSRKEIIQPTLLDLNVIVAEMRVMLGRLIGEDVTVVLGLAPSPALVTADRGQVEQILLNLAINARDAMPKGGTLTIGTANADLAEHDANPRFAIKPGPCVVLTVTDTGTGMTPAVQARLFEPFFTTKELGKGTGLGLATVHGIVTRSGGSTCVESEVGRGTSFRVYFPRADAADPVVAPPPVAVRRTGTLTVLVVEDEKGVRKLIKRLLGRQGYTILVAANANDARRLFDANPSIDLLLTDVVMPGSSGPELVRQLVERRPALKVIYMSGYTDETIVHHGVLNPGIAFLHKPFTSQALGRKIQEVLDRYVSG